MASANGACQASAAVSGRGTFSGRRRTGASAPTATAPSAARRRALDFRLLKARGAYPATRTRRGSDRRPGRPRLLGRGDRARHQLLGGRALEAEDLHPPLELAVGEPVE